MKLDKNILSLSVLYVEDDITVNAIVSNILKTLRIKITSTKDGLEGLEEFRQNKYDLVISDINMPNMDGLEMSRQIRILNSKIPIILVSGNSDGETFLKSIEIGVNGYLVKPINLITLVKELTRVMQPVLVERELQEKNKLLEVKNRELMIAKTINMIAHQWKQPLTTINAIATSMKIKSELDQLSKSSLNDGLDNIVHHTKSLASVIDKFKILSDDKTITEFECSQLFEKLNFMVGSICLNNNIFLDFKVPQDYQIKSNKSEFLIVLVDIVLNSVKQFQKFPQEKNEIKVFSTITPMAAFITISDNAGGFSEECLSRAGEFYYSEDSLNSKGIGLYLAKTSLRILVDGELSIQNWEENSQRGAEVVISIPQTSIIF